MVLVLGVEKSDAHVCVYGVGVKGRQNLTHVHACAVLVLEIISVSVRVRKT